MFPGCNARLVLHDQTVKKNPQHGHDEQRAEITVHKAKKRLKEQAATSDMSTTRMVAEAVSGLDYCLGKMARSAAKRHHANPASLEDLSFPPSYLLTASGDNLLLWDSEYPFSLRRSYLFGTPSNLEVLGSCNNLVIDGTFKVAPSLFTQLLTIHGITTDHYRMPLAYGLLPGKRQEHYKKSSTPLDPSPPPQMTGHRDIISGQINN